VRAQSLAPSEANQPSAVALLNVPLLTYLVKLHLGQAGKPVAKIFAVAERSQLGAVGNTIVVRINRIDVCIYVACELVGRMFDRFRLGGEGVVRLRSASASRLGKAD
jgi:hypothetical protein